MKRNAIFILLVLVSAGLAGQTPVGSWSDHLMYSSATEVAAGGNEIFASTGSSLLIYNTEYSELKRMSEVNGLSETGISAIGLSAEKKALVLGYRNCNIDIISNNIVYNIPDVERKYIPGLKTINRIRCAGKYAYLACSFGIVVLDIEKREISDTWKPAVSSAANEVNDIAFGGGKVFAATSSGVFEATLNDAGLAYYGSWKIIGSLPSPTARYTGAVWSNGKLYVNHADPLAGGDIVYQVGAETIFFSYLPGVFNRSIDNSGDGFIISSPAMIREFGSSGSLTRKTDSFTWGTPDISQAVIHEGYMWIADRSAGLVRLRNYSEYTKLVLPGPASNTGFSISSGSGKTVICGGGISPSWNNLGNPLTISVHENNNWNNISATEIIDPLRSLIDAHDAGHIFISTWGAGLLEYRDNVLVRKYDEYNSPLQSIIPGKPYSRLCGIAQDKKGYVWITQTGVPGSIKALKPDGGWIVNPLTIDAPTIGDIIITAKGHKWIILPRGYGLFVLDDKGTPDVFTDDRSRKFLIRDAENNVISNVYSIAEDLEGAIWVGTDQGPLVYYNPDRLFDDDIRASRPKVPRNDGTDFYDYLLKNETISAVAVDGANRKWIGTSNSGAFLVSPDGSRLINSFSEKNSPLFSSAIVSLAIDDKTGDVWFGTAEGIQSYRGLATKGGDTFSSIYAFPNPVREDYEGKLTITGLIKDTQVRITDVSGNLVYRTVSSGGQAEWDLTSYKGRRVATGVYLIFCASTDGSQAVVIKVLVIN